MKTSRNVALVAVPPPAPGSDDLPREFREAVACLGETENLAEWAKLRKCDCGSDTVQKPHWGLCALECPNCLRWVDRLNWIDALDEWDRRLPATVPPGVPVLDLTPDDSEDEDQNAEMSNAPTGAK